MKILFAQLNSDFKKWANKISLQNTEIKNKIKTVSKILPYIFLFFIFAFL